MARTKIVAVTPVIDDVYEVDDGHGSTFSSGCTLLDCVLGGGWAYGRILNLAGNSASGKSLLAIEAAANFRMENPGCPIVYAECEAAFDFNYASSIGLPPDQITFPEVYTVEDVFRDIEDILKNKDPSLRMLYIVDSLDALSDTAEQKRGIDEGSYAMAKAKMMSTWMRKQNQIINKNNITLLLISQVRDNVGVVFGEKNKRSGGRALDFYSSQIVWLAQQKQLKRTHNKVERVYGTLVKATVKKNRIAPPFRVCVFPVVFGYGVQDVIANINWLIETDLLDKAEMDAQEAKRQTLRLEAMPDDEFYALATKLSTVVTTQWEVIEESFRPTRSKYV